MESNGSIWRKWDLHVHTPDTKLNNQYKNTTENFNQFMQKLENSDVAAFGITDYFSIDGYNNFIKKFNQQYPHSGKVFFPNIELRLGSKNAKDDHVQIHIIFSNDSKTVNKISNFLGRLELISTDDHIGTKQYCTTETLSEVGYKNAMVEFNCLIHTLKNEFSTEEYLVVGVAHGYGTLRPNGPHDGKGAQYAKELDKGCHLFFSRSRDSDFYLNKTKGKTKGRTQYNLPPKPVITGSDAHSFNDLEKKLGKKCDETDSKSEITWIKADPTFEGLKQIIQEPDERVKIQEEKPDSGKRNYNIIKGIKFNSTDQYFNNGYLYFNPNLNTVIGGRSTGKSTLLKTLAYKLGVLDDNEKNDFIINCSNAFAIDWQDGEQDPKDRNVEYFPQSYMHNIARDEGRRKALIEKIIGKNQIESYEAFIDSNKLEIKKNLSKLVEDDKKIKEIDQSIKDIGSKEAIKQEISNLDSQINDLMQESQLTQQEQEQFNQFQTQLNDINSELDLIKKDMKSLNNIDNKVVDDSYKNKFLDLSESRRKLLSRVFKIFSSGVNKTWKKILLNKINKLDRLMQEKEASRINIENKRIYKKGKAALENNSNLNNLTNTKNNEQNKLDSIEKYEEKRKSLQEQKNELIKDIIGQHNKFQIRIKDLKNNFSPDNINDYDQNLRLEITYDILPSEEVFTDLDDYINKKNTDAKNFIGTFYDDYLNQNNRDNYLITFINKVLDGELKTKGNKTKLDFLESILTTNVYKYNYNLQYQNDNFENMSEGKKAFVILKLLLDFSEEKCPILIDQPEDSLDNRAIYRDLAAYIRKKKKERQIIIVTHNANLVVNTDAEQVIVANQHGTGSENLNQVKFQYKAGSLENTCKAENKSVLESKNMKEHICEILEGGEEAFKRRNKRYLIIK